MLISQNLDHYKILIGLSSFHVFCSFLSHFNYTLVIISVSMKCVNFFVPKYWRLQKEVNVLHNFLSSNMALCTSLLIGIQLSLYHTLDFPPLDNCNTQESSECTSGFPVAVIFVQAFRTTSTGCPIAKSSSNLKSLSGENDVCEERSCTCLRWFRLVLLTHLQRSPERFQLHFAQQQGILDHLEHLHWWVLRSSQDPRDFCQNK